MANKLLLSIATLLLIVITYSCNQSPSLKEGKPKATKATTKALKQDNLIDFPCAVLVYPSNKTIARLKKEGPEDDFYTAADDNLYYMSQCIDYLDSVKTKKLTRETEGVVFFKTAAGKVYKIHLDSLQWGVLLFNGKSKPIEADMTSIENDYKPYMNN